MRQLAKDIDGFLNEVILQAENQHEILIGHCTSEVALTNTQEHILMLLSEESLTNSELARRLNVSQAAVTKAIKSLVKEGMLETSKDPKDARVIFYQLTDLARPIAEEHHHHHEHTLLTYEQVATQFTPNEQKSDPAVFDCFSRRNQIMRYITVEDLSFYYDKEPVLEHINYSVDSGEFVTLTGENGAAKTTLIKASLGILQPRIGKVTISKTNTQGKKLRIAYLPQQIASFNAGFPSTVYEFVKSGRYPRKGWFRRLNAHDEEHIKASLDSVGMWEHRDKRLGSLSGGQKQRAVIARMFASDPDVFILDEPTTGMDAGSKNEFYELMHHSAHHHGKAVLMITHDPEEVKDYADRNIHLVRNQDSPWRCFNVHENDQEVGHA